MQPFSIFSFIPFCLFSLVLQQFQLIMQVNLCSSPAFGGGGTQIVSQFEMKML